MPEYLAPGVFVEEVSFRSKSIEGVSTTTTGFVGPTRYGPTDLEPEILTSLADFQRIYGDGRPLVFGGAAVVNDMWHAARAFFDNHGARLYVSRITDGATAATGSFGPMVDNEGQVVVRARFPGAAGSRRVRLTVDVGQNAIASSDGAMRLAGATGSEVVLVRNPPVGDPPAEGEPPPPAVWAFARARSTPGTGAPTWSLAEPIAFLVDGSTAVNDPATTHLDGAGTLLGDLESGVTVSILTLSVTDLPTGGDAGDTWRGLALDPGHERGGEPDSVFDAFASAPRRRAEAMTLPFVIEPRTRNDVLETVDGMALLQALLAASPELGRALRDPESTPLQRSITVDVTGGSDGIRPGGTAYPGEEDPDTGRKTGLLAFEDLEDISIVAAPGSTRDRTETDADANAAIDALISHCQRMRYRIAVLDSCNGMTVGAVRAQRARLDSSHAALYYPWIVVLDPISRAELALPPSGFVAGIYARNDRLRAVYKAPANEVVSGALRFEVMVSRGQQEVLNPEGVNCFRFFEGRGNRLWGARTVSSDPEWKYVNLRRYFAYVERSIDIGTQWAVFEPNGERLWGNVRRTIEDFLFNEFQMGALLGDKPEKAYFVKCDRSTMTQNDLDNGRLVCLIGIAALRPAEFVIFRIGQWTADRRA